MVADSAPPSTPQLLVDGDQFEGGAGPASSWSLHGSSADASKKVEVSQPRQYRKPKSGDILRDPYIEIYCATTHSDNRYYVN